jgi:hypothetical protein
VSSSRRLTPGYQWRILSQFMALRERLRSMGPRLDQAGRGVKRSSPVSTPLGRSNARVVPDQSSRSHPDSGVVAQSVTTTKHERNPCEVWPKALIPFQSPLPRIDRSCSGGLDRIRRSMSTLAATPGNAERGQPRIGLVNTEDCPARELSPAPMPRRTATSDTTMAARNPSSSAWREPPGPVAASLTAVTMARTARGLSLDPRDADVVPAKGRPLRGLCRRGLADRPVTAMLLPREQEPVRCYTLSGTAERIRRPMLHQ